MQNEYKKFKIIIIGEGLVGKTCILLRYTDKPFRENTLATIGNFLKYFISIIFCLTVTKIEMS